MGGGWARRPGGFKPGRRASVWVGGGGASFCPDPPCYDFGHAARKRHPPWLWGFEGLKGSWRGRRGGGRIRRPARLSSFPFVIAILQDLLRARVFDGPGARARWPGCRRGGFSFAFGGCFFPHSVRFLLSSVFSAFTFYFLISAAPVRFSAFSLCFVFDFSFPAFVRCVLLASFLRGFAMGLGVVLGSNGLASAPLRALAPALCGGQSDVA